MMNEYPSPVNALLSYGEPQFSNNPELWPDYVKDYSLSISDTPYLVSMLRDDSINNADSKDPRVWAAVHAWRSLGQLAAVDAIPDLIALVDGEEEDDWVLEEVPLVLAKMGPPVIPYIANLVADSIKSPWKIAGFCMTLKNISETYPETRQICVGIILKRLSNYKDNDPELNGFLIGNLVDLKAIEHVDLMREAFSADAVDCTIAGDLQDIEIELGLRTKPSPPAISYLAEKSILHENILHTNCRDGDCSHGVNLPIVRDKKIGRNEPCICGSGKKYKKCCLVIA